MNTIFLTNHESLIIDSINLIDYNYTPKKEKETGTAELLDKLNFIYNLFITENNIKVGTNKTLNEAEQIKLFTNWLRGLPNCFALPIYYNDFLDWLNITNQKPKNEIHFISNFYKNCSTAFFTLLNNL